MFKVVIDVDGVLLDVHTELEKRLRNLGYDFGMDRVLTYDFNKSLSQDRVPLWLMETDNGYDFYLNVPRSVIFEELANVELFKKADFFEDAIEKVKELSKLPNVQVVIATQSFTEDIAIIKRERLIEKLKGVSIEYIDFIGSNKGIVEGADYVIEDCIDNLDMYSCSKVLVSKPYNQRENNTSVNKFEDIHTEQSSVDAVHYVACNICS